MALLPTLAVLAGELVRGAAGGAAVAACRGGAACVAARGGLHGGGDSDDEQSLMQLRAPRAAAAAADEPDWRAQARQVLERLRAHEGWRPRRAARDDGDAAEVECHLERPEDGGCALRGMRRDRIYQVYPGGETACLNKSTPYYFRVKKGDPDKLLYNFQGGGACWDKFTYNVEGACLHEPNPEKWAGVLNFTDPANPYQNYTMVIVMYCSGDLHAGSTTQPWEDDDGLVQIRGFHNADAVLTWALDQFPQLSSLVFQSCSAGSLALHYWADRVIDRFSDRGAGVVAFADSFAGILWPPTDQFEAQSFLFRTWGMCNNSALDLATRKKCNDGTWLLQQHFRDTMRRHPDAKFNTINSKTDAVQILFAKGYMLTALRSIEGARMSPEQFYQQMNLILEQYAAEPNFHSYLVDGEQHCFTPYELAYTTTPLSAHGEESVGPKLTTWMGGFTRQAPVGAAFAKGVPTSVCIGPEENVSRGEPAPDGTSYCAAGV